MFSDLYEHYIFNHKQTPLLNGYFLWARGCPLTGGSTVHAYIIESLYKGFSVGIILQPSPTVCKCPLKGGSMEVDYIAFEISVVKLITLSLHLLPSCGRGRAKVFQISFLS